MTAGPVLDASRREGFDAAYEQVRGDGSIQFAPEFAKPADPPPQWWDEVSRWLGKLLEPIAHALAAAWPWLSKLLLVALLVIGNKRT